MRDVVELTMTARRLVDIEDVRLHKASEAAVKRSNECSVEQAQGKPR